MPASNDAAAANQAADHRADRAAVTDMLAEASAALVRSTYPAPQADEIIGRLAKHYNAEPEVALLPTMVLSQATPEAAPRMQVVKSSYRFDQMVAAQSVISQASTSTLDPAQVADSLRARQARAQGLHVRRCAARRDPCSTRIFDLRRRGAPKGPGTAAP